IYEENVRVPYLVIVPGLVRGQIRVRNTASLIDTVPTILDLLGLSIPEDYQGVSLLEPPPKIALFYADYSFGLLGLRDGQWKLIYELESSRAKLFDLTTDPNETKNVAAQELGRVKAYQTHLQRWAAAQRDLTLHPPHHALLARDVTD